MKYKIGMIVKWNGFTPAIGKITGKCTTFGDCYTLGSGNSHNSCHESNISKPTTNLKRKYSKAKNGDIINDLIVLK